MVDGYFLTIVISINLHSLADFILHLHFIVFISSSHACIKFSHVTHKYIEEPINT